VAVSLTAVVHRAAAAEAVADTTTGPNPVAPAAPGAALGDGGPPAPSPGATVVPTTDGSGSSDAGAPPGPPQTAAEPVPTAVPPPPPAALPSEDSVSSTRDEAAPDGLARRSLVGQAYLTGGFVYGHSTNPHFAFDLAGLGFEAGASFLVGPRFPGLHGGLWNGVLIQPGINAYAAAEVPRPLDVSTLQGAFMFGGGVLLAYQLFGLPMVDDERQAGVGLSIGYRIGYQYDLVLVGESGKSAHSGDISHGAVLSVVMPRYYPRGDHFGRVLFNLEADRLPDSRVNLFKLNIGGGF
jgi:hypothetical protein